MSSLDQIQVASLDARPRQRLLRGRDRPFAHQLRLDAGHRGGDEARPRRTAEPPQPFGRREQLRLAGRKPLFRRLIGEGEYEHRGEPPSGFHRCLQPD